MSVASVQELCLKTGKESDRNAGKLLREADSAMQIHRVKKDLICEGFKFEPIFFSSSVHFGGWIIAKVRKGQI